jgi:hypothetical protein
MKSAAVGPIPTQENHMEYSPTARKAPGSVPADAPSVTLDNCQSFIVDLFGTAEAVQSKVIDLHNHLIGVPAPLRSFEEPRGSGRIDVLYAQLQVVNSALQNISELVDACRSKII